MSVIHTGLASRGIGEKIVKIVGNSYYHSSFFLVVLMNSYISSGRILLSVTKNVVDHWWPEETEKDLEKGNDRPDRSFIESTDDFLRTNR